MFRYQILIEYVGTSFRGWQVQKKGKTIQGLIQEKISNLLKEKIILLGSGRTDTGVHAIEQSAHFDCKNEIWHFDKFLKSMNHFLNKDGVTILKIRKRNEYFVSPSFSTISAFGANASVPHYRVSRKTNVKFSKDSLYLVDSGGQYFDGTTDITRTIALGKPTNEQKDRFTRVLKGHIALSTVIFSRKTKGSDLDYLARKFLKKINCDYDHGTGHGIGSFLSVHEGPQRISKLPRKYDCFLKNGMILSNEPGYYK